MIHIDAKGMACPQPVIMARNALLQKPDGVEVLVDNTVAAENVSRFLKSQGYSAEIANAGTNFAVTGLRLDVAQGFARNGEAPAVKAHNAVFIAHNTIGGGDAELGEVLMKAFLGTLAQYEDAQRPAVVALMNEGVKLAVSGTPSCEALQEYASTGGSVLVCGTCLKHFGLMGKIGVGSVSNMFEIASVLLKSNTLCL